MENNMSCQNKRYTFEVDGHVFRRSIHRDEIVPVLKYLREYRIVMILEEGNDTIWSFAKGSD